VKNCTLLIKKDFLNFLERVVNGERFREIKNKNFICVSEKDGYNCFSN